MYKITISEAPNGRIVYVGFFEDSLNRYRGAYELIRFYREERNLDVKVVFEDDESDLRKNGR